MSTEGSTRAVVAALLANLGIAVTKSIARVIYIEPDLFRTERAGARALAT